MAGASGLSAAEFAEIHNLYGFYNLSSDPADAEGYADCLTADGAMLAPGLDLAVRGRAGLIAHKLRDLAGRGGAYRRHWNGSLPTLASVVDWFEKTYSLGLAEDERADLTSYLETVGDGTQAYEDTRHVLAAELEEVSFFLSTYDFLKQRGKVDLISTTLETIAFEIRAHKWDVQDPVYLPVLERLAQLMDEAYEANQRRDREMVSAKTAQYRELYEINREHLK